MVMHLGFTLQTVWSQSMKKYKAEDSSIRVTYLDPCVRGWKIALRGLGSKERNQG